MGERIGSSGYPWDRLNEVEGYTYIGTGRCVVKEEGKDAVGLKYKKKLDNVTSYLECDIANSFSLLRKSKREKHQEILSRIYILEDILKLLKEE